MAAAAPTAERLQSEALRLDSEVKNHRRERNHHARRIKEKAAERDRLVQQCRELGIRLVFPDHDTQPIGGHSDTSSPSSS